MSNINKAAMIRITNSPLGEALLTAFMELEKQMDGQNGTDVFAQIGFLEPEEQMAGGLIPTIHLSLRKPDPIVSSPVELVWQDGKEDT